MKSKGTIYTPLLVIAVSFMIFTTGCKKSTTTTTSSSAASFEVINLDADVSSYPGAKVDANLVNAWGIAIGPTGKIWISSTGKDLTTIYDGTGATLLAPIAIPNSGSRTTHGPTGAMFNNTTEFMIPSNSTVSKFIYVNLDGTISAWSAGSTAVIVANRSAEGASYTGAALGKVGSTNYLYAANFGGSKIDVFTSTFTYNVSFAFIDPNLPQGYSPYNIVNIGDVLYVTYAPSSGNGAGGYVDEFSPDGTFIKRLASGGTLNFPWGIAIAPAAFNLGSNMILVGNFGDGKISIFDQLGNFKGQIQANGSALSIDGLWALANAPSTATSLSQDVVYFTAGPSYGLHGLFGYLKLTPVTTSGSSGGY